MKRTRILLLSVAIIAGGLAAFLATKDDNSPQIVQTVAKVKEENRTKIIIASKAIGVGERLNASLVRWEDWPSGAVRPEYITIDMVPDALDELSGAVARFEFFDGEPIREAKLVRSDQGFLSAVIAPGMRAVSIGVSAESGAGGFIVPNDRVDVVLTSDGAFGERSDTILQNVKVLVIDRRLGQLGGTGGSDDPNEVENNTFQNDTIAVLELDPAQSEIVINASEIGQLDLVLRSVADFNEEIPAGIAMRNSTTVRMIRYGKGEDILPAEVKMAGRPQYQPSPDYPPANASESESINFDPVSGQIVDAGLAEERLHDASASNKNSNINKQSENVLDKENVLATNANEQ